MLSSSILDKEVGWLKTASEGQLRELVKVLDDNPTHPRHDIVAEAFDAECNRRAAEAAEARNGGEWI